MYILKALDSVEKLETKIADLYEWLSVNMADDPEAASLFFRMSVDETAHANLVKYQRRMIQQNMKLFSDVNVDIEGIQKSIAHVETIRRGDPPSVEEATRIALELENNAAETHYRTLILESSSGITDLLNGLSSLDCKHCGIFEEFAAKRGYPFVSDHRKIEESLASHTAEPPQDIDEQHSSISKELLEKIDNLFVWYNSMNFYELLGVTDHAKSDEIKHAFRDRAKEFHPDRLINVPEDIKKKVTAIFGKITLAYLTLMNPDKRREYELTHIRRSRH